MSEHTIQTEIEVMQPDGDNAYPTFEVTFDYERGYTPGTPRGEYAPIDPPVGPALSFREAKLLATNSVKLEFGLLHELAKEWLLGPGRNYAIDCAETDLRAMRHAHLEDRRDQ